MTSSKRQSAAGTSMKATPPAGKKKPAAAPVPPRKTSPAAGKKPRAGSPVGAAASLPKAVVAAPIPVKTKDKLVRDSFTIPKTEYAVLELIKARAANLMRPAKKSELLRAGISILHGLDDAALLAAINAVPSLKTGRPKAAGAG